MPSRVASTVAWGIWILTAFGTIIAFPSLPSTMATHFDASGNVNGTMSAWIGAFLLPLITLLVLLLLQAIPRIDPLRVNIAQFRPQYDWFVAFLMLFFAAIQAMIIVRNLGARFDPLYVILPAIGLLFFYIGVLMPQTKRNWFIGIRTPWTISSDRVWQKTHELGGLLFKVLGVVIVLSAFVPSYAVAIICSLLAVIVVGLFGYSYSLYEEERRA